ncbi:hypothetical protein [Timonella sp. A28]|uniref:hypothetical protein n=1 Tax=Timonella sp. A28 TaxID=3442640 RepID=UPI003EB87EE8
MSDSEPEIRIVKPKTLWITTAVFALYSTVFVWLSFTMPTNVVVVAAIPLLSIVFFQNTAFFRPLLAASKTSTTASKPSAVEEDQARYGLHLAGAMSLVALAAILPSVFPKIGDNVALVAVIALAAPALLWVLTVHYFRLAHTQEKQPGLI